MIRFDHFLEFGTESRKDFILFYLIYIFSLFIIFNIYTNSSIPDFISQAKNINLSSPQSFQKANLVDFDLQLAITLVLSYLILELLVFFNLCRRLHDSGKSAIWYILVYLASFVSSVIPFSKYIVIFLLGLMKKDEESKYRIKKKATL